MKISLNKLQSIIPSSIENIKNYGVLADYDETFQVGKIVVDGLEEEEANDKCSQYGLVFPTVEFTVVRGTSVADYVKIAPKYCSKCGNTGIDADGNICDCRFNPDTFFGDVACLDIPEQFRGLVFNAALLPNDLDSSYGAKLRDIATEISLARLHDHNYLICSPHRHGKTIFAYSCIERLFKAGIKVFPVCDIMEIRRVMNDVDFGRESITGISEPENIWLAPYIFIKIPSYLNWEAYDTINTVLGRRVRKGTCTIFLYSGTYEMLTRNDKTELISSIRGDGSYSTVEILEWRKKGIDVE